MVSLGQKVAILSKKLNGEWKSGLKYKKIDLFGWKVELDHEKVQFQMKKLIFQNEEWILRWKKCIFSESRKKIERENLDFHKCVEHLLYKKL